MTIIVEDGTGVVGAETYAAVAFTDTYWSARTHNSLGTTWSAAPLADKEGA